MRVRVDEAGVEDLLSKRSDQLVGGLTNGKTVRFKPPQVEAWATPSVSTHVFQTQPLFFDFLQVVDLAAVAELGRQNPLRKASGPRQPPRDGQHARQQAHLTGLLPEDFGNRNESEVLQLLRAPLGVPGLVLKVQLLSQRLLQVLQEAKEMQFVSDLNGLAHPSTKGTPDLQDPTESKTGMHKLDDIQEDLQGSDVPIKTIPEVDVLHLWGPGTTVH